MKYLQTAAAVVCAALALHSAFAAIAIPSWRLLIYVSAPCAVCAVSTFLYAWRVQR